MCRPIAVVVVLISGGLKKRAEDEKEFSDIQSPFYNVLEPDPSRGNVSCYDVATVIDDSDSVMLTIRLRHKRNTHCYSDYTNVSINIIIGSGSTNCVRLFITQRQRIEHAIGVAITSVVCRL